jgi:hypothetical protein
LKLRLPPASLAASLQSSVQNVPVLLLASRFTERLDDGASAYRDVSSAGDGASSFSPQAKKRCWNVVARASWTQLPDASLV